METTPPAHMGIATPSMRRQGPECPLPLCTGGKGHNKKRAAPAVFVVFHFSTCGCPHHKRRSG